MPIEPRVLADFEGAWHLDRQIHHDDGTTAQFQGTASWVPEGDALLYHERGQLQIAGQVPLTSEQRYRWYPDLRVTFDDGRAFHTVPATGGETAHWCDPDQYDVTYDFTNWPAFRVTWNVKGPRKSYRMISAYTRA